jgi:exopolysaccharide/PEP-CTERM locus tyrosine autokinase
MSLVEQALKKAKLSGQPLPLSTQAPPAPPVVEDVALPVVERKASVGEEVIEPSPEITATVQPLKFLQVDRDALRAAGYLPPPDQEREIEEQYRHAKRPLVQRALGRGQERLPLGMRIAVTSALQGEGKTFTSINLALSIALEKDVRVVLVDADIARAEVSRVFGVGGQPGLIDALAHPELDAASLVHDTTIEGLQIMPAGRADATATEWLASPRMDEVMRRLAGKDDDCVVILDSPPLLVTNEAKAVCEAVGQVVVVVRANVTPQRAVTEAIAHIPAGRYTALLLNAAEGVPGVGYGYYGYSYRYGHYGRTG